MNYAAVDKALEKLTKIELPAQIAPVGVRAGPGRRAGGLGGVRAGWGVFFWGRQGRWLLLGCCSPSRLGVALFSWRRPRPKPSQTAHQNSKAKQVQGF